MHDPPRPWPKPGEEPRHEEPDLAEVVVDAVGSFCDGVSDGVEQACDVIAELFE